MKLRNLITVSALGLCALVARVQAQQYIPTTAINGGTNNIAAETTNSALNVVLTSKGPGTHIAIQPSFKLDDSGSSAVVFKFDESVDGEVWKSAARSISVTANGTNVVGSVSNFEIGAVGLLRLSTVENPNAANITNLTLKYVAK